MHAQLLSRVQFFATLWTVAHQTPLSMVFSRQEYWSGLSCPFPGNRPHPGMAATAPGEAPGRPTACSGEKAGKGAGNFSGSGSVFSPQGSPRGTPGSLGRLRTGVPGGVYLGAASFSVGVGPFWALQGPQQRPRLRWVDASCAMSEMSPDHSRSPRPGALLRVFSPQD